MIVSAALLAPLLLLAVDVAPAVATTAAIVALVAVVVNAKAIICV